MTDLFSGLISSKTRIFFNPGTRAYLRELAKEFNLSTNAVREELNQLTKTELLTSEKEGRSVYYRANSDHPLFPELRSMVGKPGSSTTTPKAKTPASSTCSWWATSTGIT